MLVLLLRCLWLRLRELFGGAVAVVAAADATALLVLAEVVEVAGVGAVAEAAAVAAAVDNGLRVVKLSLDCS